MPLKRALADTAAGVHEMSIWLNGRDVYLLMVCNDYKAATAYLDKQPKSLEWEEWMAPMMETGEGDEYDPAHAYPDGLPEVFRWEASTSVKCPAPPTDKLALYYLPVRARAENIRMMLAYAGVEYVDHVIPFDEWKAEGGLKGDMPFGQLPSIELPGSPGRFIAQSGSCSRAVANICGLCPVDLVEMSYQDSLFEAGQELSSINPICNVFTGETLATKKAEFFSAFPTKRDNLGKQLCASPDADFLIYHNLENCVAAEPTCLDGSTAELKALRKFMASVGALDGVREYLAARPAMGVGAGAGGVGLPGSIMATTVDRDD